MRHMRSGVVWVLAGVCFLPGAALAQIVMQHCSIDRLDSVQAEFRLGWMRRCALLNGASGPVDTGGVAGNGGPLWEYIEPGDPWSGMNMYTGSYFMGEVNYSYINQLYMSGSTYQTVDASGFYRWYRTHKKARPLYPIYGSRSDITSASNQQLFPHPTLANCSFYYDRAGTQPATGVPFYLNAYCEAAPAPTPLTNGVPVAVSGAAGSMQYFSLIVPAGIDSVVFQTSGGTGDVDLYVRYGALPDEATHDCRSTLGGNNDGCNVPSPAAGTWYVMLKGYAAYSGVSLMGTYFY